jgi:hypothetical protein
MGKVKRDSRTVAEIIDNTLYPFRITKHHDIKCICGHSVSFHHLIGVCKGSVTDGCKCEEVRIKKQQRSKAYSK